ncbi:amidohydrolase [Paracoccus sp. TK19116]|uniref:Amidohydrolase n=1 Tax=Paracoccus albicereus TaxID=2922394 RepID=A0ABT1MSK3_9RHOB|nr:amidohydrolase family protein [Paracoccus albicereus]MCQ0971109.1 amidohydrolase [Paracoccus albicereus]
MKKIDMFNHIWPQPFYQALIGHIGTMTDITKRSGDVPMMTDLDRRFQVMDMFGEGYQQVLSLASPPLELLAGPDKAVELARIGTDSMAELCQKYPDRFPAFIGTAPMGDPEAAVAESRHAIEAGASGMQIFTNVGGKPLDRPEFDPFFAYMAEVGKPVWMHPARGANFTDYLAEEKSEYEIWWTFGWPYETSAAMARMVFSGLFDKHPGLKVITHHAGGMIPFFEGRVGPGWDQMGKRTSDRDLKAEVLDKLQRPHLEYFKEFYADTASFGSQKAIEHAIEFFGEDRVIFASDAPFDPEGGPKYIRDTIEIIERMDISDDLRAKIFHRNAETLLGLAA